MYIESGSVKPAANELVETDQLDDIAAVSRCDHQLHTLTFALLSIDALMTAYLMYVYLILGGYLRSGQYQRPYTQV